MNIRQFRPFTPALIAAAVAALVTAQPASGQTNSTEAAVINITDINHPSPTPIIIADTGPVDDSGGILFDYVRSTNVYDGALTLQNGWAIAAEVPDWSTAEASLEKLSIEFTDMSGDGVVHTLTADAVIADALADNTLGGVIVAGSSVIRGLVLDGQPLVVTGEANQTNSFNGFTIVLNELTTSSGADSGGITVTAIHITENGCMNAKLVTVSAGMDFTDRSSGRGPQPHSPGCGR